MCSLFLKLRTYDDACKFSIIISSLPSRGEKLLKIPERTRLRLAYIRYEKIFEFRISDNSRLRSTDRRHQGDKNFREINFPIGKGEIIIKNPPPRGAGRKKTIPLFLLKAKGRVYSQVISTGRPPLPIPVRQGTDRRDKTFFFLLFATHVLTHRKYEKKSCFTLLLQTRKQEIQRPSRKKETIKKHFEIQNTFLFPPYEGNRWPLFVTP